MLFTQVSFRWMDETAAAQIDSDGRFNDTRIIGFLDKDLDGKIEKAELRGQVGKQFTAQFDTIDTNHDGAIDKAEMKVAMAKMGMMRRKAPSAAEQFNGGTPMPAATPAAAGGK
jgi:hypothetical protein